MRMIEHKLEEDKNVISIVVKFSSDNYPDTGGCVVS